MQFRRAMICAVILCAFLVSQAQQTSPQTGPQPPRPNPGGPEMQPVRPAPGGGNRPRPPRPNPGGPQIQPIRPNPGGNRPRPPRPIRPPQWGRPPQNRPSYHFRRNDRAWLRRYYLRNLGYINRANQPRFVIGGFFPFAYISYLSPVPPHVYNYLPPPPPGYQLGYYDGYVVVYDPNTYFIANVIDLLQ